MSAGQEFPLVFQILACKYALVLFLGSLARVPDIDWIPSKYFEPTVYA